MEWQDGRGGGGIEDRRGLGAVGTGGLGVGGVALALIGYFVFGLSPSDTLRAVDGGGGSVAGFYTATRVITMPTRPGATAACRQPPGRPSSMIGREESTTALSRVAKLHS